MAGVRRKGSKVLKALKDSAHLDLPNRLAIWSVSSIDQRSIIDR